MNEIAENRPFSYAVIQPLVIARGYYIYYSIFVPKPISF